MTSILIALLSGACREQQQRHVFRNYTVISGSGGGVFDHAHAIERVKLTPDLRAMGAVFAFAPKDGAVLHHHDGVYFVKKPTGGGGGGYLPDVYRVVNGVSVPTRVLAQAAWHCHPIHVVYTPSAASPKRARPKRTRGRKKRDGPSSPVAPHVCDERKEHLGHQEHRDLLEIGEAMGSYAYQHEKYKTPVIDFDMCDRCFRARKKHPKRSVLSHALLVFR